MNRDMDLVRQILFAIEEAPSENDADISIDGRTTAEIHYHLILLEDADLIKANYQQTINGEISWLSIRLTWNGHEFLDASRDNSRWERAKSAMEKAGGFVLPVAMQLLTQYLKAELKLP